MEMTTFVYGFWTVAGILAVLLIGGAFILGLRDTKSSSLRKWRFRKLLSAVLGVVGLLLLLMNFERVVREGIQDDSREYALSEFLDARFYATYHAALACANKDKSEGAKLTCFDIDQSWRQFYQSRLRDSTPFSRITNWQGNPDILEFAERMNRHIDHLNRTLPVATTPSTFSKKNQFAIVMLATILVIVALAGSVGEAAYQYRQAVEMA